MEEKTGWEETKVIWGKPENRLFYKLLGAVVLVGIGILVGRAIYTAPEADQAWGYGVNLFTGVISTAATVLILDQLAERRADRKAEEALTRQLVMDSGSLSNEIAKNAIHQLRRRGWLEWETGLLKRMNLIDANLREVDLRQANLQGTNFGGANLQGAILVRAELQGAHMIGAHLQGANLGWAEMQGADLTQADLRDAFLWEVHLQGANLSWARLQGADLEGVMFNESTRLPDHTWKKPSLWTKETDMRRFTDPDHPHFFQPDW